MPVGGAAATAGVLGLQDGPQGDGQEGGAEPVGLDGELVLVGDFVPEARDAGVEDAEVDLEVGRVADAVRKGGDAGVVGQVDGPDFDGGGGGGAAAAGAFVEGEEGGFGRLAFFDVADGEDQPAEAEGEELGGRVVA